MGRRRVFIIDGAETMRWDVANVFLKILEEPPGPATLILTAPSPHSLLPTIVSRCLQFHFTPLPAAEVESILKEKSDLAPAAIRLAAQLSEGSPGYALEMDAEKESLRRRDGLKILERAARGEEFGQVFAQTNVISKDREISFEEQLSVFYSLLSDLLELTSGIDSPQLRNAPLSKELASVARRIDADWVMRGLHGLDRLAAGARRNLNRQLGLDALAADPGCDLVPVVDRFERPEAANADTVREGRVVALADATAKDVNRHGRTLPGGGSLAISSNSRSPPVRFRDRGPAEA